MTHWEAMIERPDEWVEQWHVLRPDADFRKVLESNTGTSSDNRGFTDSYEVLRSSPENNSGDELQPRQRSSSLGNSPVPKSVLVYPGIDASSDVASSATFPRQLENKNPLGLDDEELKALTKKNTKLNRGNGNSVTSLTDTPVKKV